MAARRKSAQKPRRCTPWTPQRAARFLKELEETGNVTHSARACGASRSQVYLQRVQDAEFSQAWDEAVEAGTEALEQEARRRALQGVEEERVGPGGVKYRTRKYSDVLLIFLLKARRPTVYRDAPPVHVHPMQQAPASPEDVRSLKAKILERLGDGARQH